MKEPLVHLECFDSLVRITLNRPDQYNPLSKAMLAELQACLDGIAADESIAVVILAAKGKAFCAGHDLKEIQQHDSDEFARELFADCSRMMISINQLPQPVIASVQGIATAAGCQLVANCDLAIASSQAQFAVSGVNLGLFCATPSVALSRNVSRKVALEMLLTGDFIDAQSALDKGLINRVVAPDELNKSTIEFARHIASKPRDVLALGKKLFYEQLDQNLEDAYVTASDRMACNLGFPSTVEGLNAFIEKRKPNWT